MIKNLLVAAFIVLYSTPCFAKKKEPPPPDPAWAGITARGRMLAEYDVAIKSALDAVRVVNPAKGTVTDWFARKTDAGWVAAFGRLNEARDKFLVVYLATQGATPQEFKTSQNIPPQENTGFFYLAAKAFEISQRDFRGEKLPYNVAVLPAESNRMYVYIYPAQTKAGIYVLGGDVRYLISADGSTIVEKRQMHKTILSRSDSLGPRKKVVGGVHSHVLSDVPEDTDVLCVLTRKPSVPEFVGAGKHVFRIDVNGTIWLEE
jgi:hypothetical protein